MSARHVTVLAIVALSSCAPVARSSPAVAANAGAALAQACAGRDGWSDPAPPARIHANTYYVGTCGISVVLIAGRAGHVLIDGATAEAVPSTLANIRALGFDPRDVRLIVGSHEHFDHMGGFAALRAATGARVMVRAPARGVVETGRPDPADPQAGAVPDMAPARVDGIVKDGEAIRLGPIALTPVATPGHTSGGTSWTWQSCDQARCLSFAYVDSMTAISGEGYRFADHPARVAPFRVTFARVATLPCDVLVTPHPGASDLFERLAGRKPLVDTAACPRLADAMRLRLDRRLASETRR